MLEMPSIIIKNLLTNKNYVSKVYPYLKDDYFSGDHQGLFKLYREYQSKYNAIPSMETMGIMLDSAPGYNQARFDSTVDLLAEIYSSEETSDLNWLVNESENYCRKTATTNAMYKCIAIENGDGPKGATRDMIPDILKEAVSISFTTDLGSDYFKSADARYEWYVSDSRKLLYPLEEFNRITDGGAGIGVHALVAGTNVGKSALMCAFAGEWLKVGKNVVYISMEMGENEINERVDANLVNVKLGAWKEGISKEEYLKRIDSIQNRTKGRFFTKQFPTGAAHVGHFRHYLKELEQKEDFVPDVVIVDYINICASVKYRGDDTNAKGKAITEELRGLCVENPDKDKWFPIFTATQFNRSGSTSIDPGIDQISESFGMVQTADSAISVVVDRDLEQHLVIKPLKLRNGSKTRFPFQIIRVDFDHMRFHSHSATSEVKTAHETALINESLSANASNTLDKLKKKGDNQAPKKVNQPQPIEW